MPPKQGDVQIVERLSWILQSTTIVPERWPSRLSVALECACQRQLGLKERIHSYFSHGWFFYLDILLTHRPHSGLMRDIVDGIEVHNLTSEEGHAHPEC